MSKFVFAFFFPFWTWILSIIKFDSPNAKNWFWYGCAFMGFVFIFYPVGGSGNDSTRIAYQLEYFHNNSRNFDAVVAVLYNEENSLDVYQSLITYLVSIFTGNPHYLFLVFALIFGFFYSRNVFMILGFSNTSKLKWWIWIVVIMYILILPIWEINGVRMWTAMHVFTYGVFSFLFRNDTKKIYWSIVSVFIHFSFIIPVFILLIYMILPKQKLGFYFVIYSVSVFFSELDIQSLKDSIIDFLPHQLGVKVGEYMNEEYVEVVAENNASMAKYIHISRLLSKYFMLLVIVFLWIKNRTFFVSEEYKKILVFYLVFGTVFEFLSAIPSFGRFLILCNLSFFALLLFLLFRFPIDNKLNTLIKYVSIMLILPILFRLRIGTDYYGFSLLWGNFLSAVLIDDNVPLIDFVKSIL